MDKETKQENMTDDKHDTQMCVESETKEDGRILLYYHFHEHCQSDEKLSAVAKKQQAKKEGKSLHV